MFKLTIWHKIVHTYNQNQNHMMQKKHQKIPRESHISPQTTRSNEASNVNQMSAIVQPHNNIPLQKHYDKGWNLFFLSFYCGMDEYRQ